MNPAINAAGPYAKALTVGVVLAAVIIADANGIETGVDIDDLWQQIGAVAVPTFLVWLVPNRAPIRQ